MAVQKKQKKTPSKRGMHRSHSALAAPAVSIDAKSGETHSRHRISRATGFIAAARCYRPKRTWQQAKSRFGPAAARSRPDV